MRKRLLIIIAITTTLGAIIAVGFLAGNRQTAGPTPSQPATSSPAPSVAPSPTAAKVYEENFEDVEARNPAVSHLPKLTPYWRLELLGRKQEESNDKLTVTATVYVKPGQDEQKAVKKQRPYIERWLAGIGQRKGTYTLRMNTEAPHVY